MSCKVRKDGAAYYIRYQDGDAYVFCGEATPTLCQSAAITNDFTLTFIDEAHPLYVVGSGNVGPLWGLDVCYYNEHLPNHPACANILFDVHTPFVARGSYQGVPIQEYYDAKGSYDPFYVIPSGINNSNLSECYSPIQDMNIVDIPRPSGGTESNGTTPAIGTISQEEFKDNIISSINTIWGNDFWSRMSSSSNKLWIIRESGLSMGTGVIQSGIDLFTSYLDTNYSNLDYQEYLSTCGDNDRYLGWIVNAVSGQGNNVSCTETYQPPNIITNIQGSGNHNPTNKLVTMSLEGYSATGGNSESYAVTINEAIDNQTTWTNGDWSYVTNGLVAEYKDLVTGGFYWTYSVYVSLFYENGLHRVSVSGNCYAPPDYQSGSDVNTKVWECIVPLDKYGIPNGVVEEPGSTASESLSLVLDYSDYSDLAVDNCPRFPSIVFTSHPSTAFIASLDSSCTLIDFVNYTTDCTSINP